MSLLVVGSVAFDSVRTPHGEAREALGGSAVYSAVAASYLTGVRMLSVVGDDFGEDPLSRLRAGSWWLVGLSANPISVMRGSSSAAYTASGAV